MSLLSVSLVLKAGMQIFLCAVDSADYKCPLYSALMDQNELRKDNLFSFHRQTG